MAFLFSSSHLPASRVRRPDLEADDDHDENREAMPRSGGVRASSHLEGRVDHTLPASHFSSSAPASITLATAASTRPAAAPGRSSTPAPAAPVPAASSSSEVYLVGGVHRTGDSKNTHDNSAHHFYTSAARVAGQRADALRKSGSPDKVSVIMYEPAYEVRAMNDGKTEPATGAKDPRFHQKIMEDSARRHNYDLKFVRSKAEMLQEMSNATASSPMKKGGYFGHSSKDKLLIDYGQTPPPAGTSQDVAYQTIDADDLKKAGVNFHPDAHFSSYGCFQGEPGGMMEQMSKNHGITTSGSRGRSNYESVGQGYAIPRSTNGYSSFKNGLPISPLIASPPPLRPKP